jgi:hypothetical protein
MNQHWLTPTFDIVRFAPIVLQGKFRESRILGDSAAAILCGADTKLRGRFLMSDEVPHISSHGTHQRF